MVKIALTILLYLVGLVVVGLVYWGIYYGIKMYVAKLRSKEGEMGDWFYVVVLSAIGLGGIYSMIMAAIDCFK